MRVIYPDQYVDGLALHVEVRVGQYGGDLFDIYVVAALSQRTQRRAAHHLVVVAELRFQGVRNFYLVEL